MDQRLVQESFPQEICARVATAVQHHPQPAVLAELFEDIARLVKYSSNQVELTEPDNKKRKLDGSAARTNGSAAAAISNPTTVFQCKDVSFQIPARKKLKLELVSDGHDLHRQEVRLQNQQSNEIEYALPADQISQAFCLPVPEKQQRQWNFVIFPKPGAASVGGTPYEQVVFTMNETPPSGAWAAVEQASENDTFVTMAARELNRMLHPQGQQLVLPNAAEFASSIPQSHRKGEKAYHVKAHRGSKEGYLFFLENGIVFGFKKPLAFFPFSSIESISYTSVLQRTFNLVIAAQDTDDSEVKEVEFSMLDQADFAGIDEYIKRHGLNDASMAAERRAKAYNVNKEKKADANSDDADGADGQTELQKAEQELQDEEDELEEDYEESGSESDSEGDYSDDEEYEYGDAADEEGAEEVEHEEDIHDED